MFWADGDLESPLSSGEPSPSRPTVVPCLETRSIEVHLGLCTADVS